jgi:cell division septum initiation protein DivIVA
MTENTTVSSNLASQYAAQVTTDLERNVKEQERVSAEIEALQEQLAGLQRDHAVLTNMQQALGLSAALAETAPAAEAPVVPAPRKKTASSAKKATATTKKATATTKKAPATTKKAAASGKAKQPRAKKTTATAAPGKGKSGDETARKSSATATKTADQPTLVDLVRGHLGEVSEPRSAAEVASALGQVHPDRDIKTTVVRTTLEGLVAKGQAQRTKQGNSVFYTAPDTAGRETEAQAVTDQSE